MTVGVHSTIDELRSARMLIDDLIDKAEQPAALQPKPTKRRPRSLAALGLPKQVHNALRDAGIRSLAKLMQQSVPGLLHVPGLGMRSIHILQAALAEHGLALSEATDEQSRSSGMAR
ncbi:DNA-directed RNA polymerase subunit alpha C-terminal domain-containing protein [Caballeronia sp. LZ035]|uniref:DNA-directed RNA polymerase subunit alpha C-terminal domain-containing protein n=1 Tax=Caballeronia sp. LZ035 TaxID=3038568 RepID=UPI00285D4F0A|nr:DNA-directed RNA polymerase subunit alpha C-terminal domain-containing protein [Caballeronia sp. LZ035]MDR5757875.1 DNA-directed RNA polymerase subunit alpha C-terminal domain-containing protein [Caballeronia sp. LZ035]